MPVQINTLDPVDESLEMDHLTAGVRHTRSISRGRPDVPDETLARLRKRDRIIGILLLLLVVILWTSSNFVTASLFEGGFEKPFLVTYLNTSSFSLYLLPFLFKQWRDRGASSSSKDPLERGRPRVAQGYQPLQSEPNEEQEEADSNTQPVQNDLEAPLTLRETIRLSFTFCFFWFIANWAVNASLDYTSVASTTILSSMSGFFTLALGRVFRVEKLTIAKILAVIVSFAGVVLVSVSDSSSTKAGPAAHPDANHNQATEATQPLLGDSLALIGALFYALYVILLKVKIGEESRINMQLFFGFVGLFNILTCWPMGLLLHVLGWEKFELPRNRDALLGVLVNMVITLLSDYIYVLAMLKTTPVTVTVGLSLTIPLAVVGDFFLGRGPSLQVLVGAVLVLLSFAGVAMDDSKQQNGTQVHEEPDG
ncbi:vacuolar membrane protein [Flagelloscypha sp. PMI_526]|nr:vacuolar membrane protein [Flagelloscypha sp. PMI_526]